MDNIGNKSYRGLRGSPATCHPDRPMLSKGLCSSCYRKKLYRKNPEKFAVQAKARRLRMLSDPVRAQRNRTRWERYYAENKENLIKKTKAWRKKNPEKLKESYLLRDYGLTLEQFNQMLKAQGQRCAVCRQPFGSESSTAPVVDHSHTTGRVRGLLCRRCNTLLGYAKDDEKILAAAAKYLAK